MLLLTSVTLLVLHSINLSSNILKLISQVIYIIYKWEKSLITTGSHVLGSRRLIDRLQFISYLISKRNACFFRTTSGKTHRYSVFAFKVVTEIVARFSFRLINFRTAFIRYLRNEFSCIEQQKQRYFSHLPLSLHTKRTADLQSYPLPKYTALLHFSMWLLVHLSR